jgi:eukaryotic-like serine/threonine-protein kinase
MDGEGHGRRGVEQELILGRYRPLEELGEGGHGVVVLAYDTKMARRVAIKRIPLSPAGVRRLDHTTGLAEARTSALLNHPNVVTVHEWDTDADEAFLIMEHVNGAPLLDLLDEYAPLDLDTAAAVLAPVAEALLFAHDNGVLHLDLKPENVLVARDGLVKVGDFGVASLTNAAGQAISAGGTLGYMPPEQLLGERVDVATDQWAFAALAFEVLTGAVPFAASTVQEALAKAEDLEPPYVTDFEPGLPPELDDVLATALAPVPAQRYRSIEEFAGALLPLLGDPAEGREALADMATTLTAEEAPAAAALAGIGMWDRLARYGGVALRLVAALGCGWLAYSGALAFGVGPAGPIAVALLAGAAGAAAPALGLALGLILFAAGVGFVFGLLPLAVFALAAAAWWLTLGRRGDWSAVAPVLSPFFGVVGISPALPMLTGFAQPGSLATAAAGAASAVTLILASFASGSWKPPFLQVGLEVVLDPLRAAGWKHAVPVSEWWLPALLMIAGWAVAAVVVSMSARRASRPAALAGVFAASLTMLLATAPWSTSTQRLVPEAAAHVGLSLILMCVVIALGPPLAAEEDYEPREE